MKTSIQKPGTRYGQEPGKALEESAEYHISTEILRVDCSFLRHLSQYKKKAEHSFSFQDLPPNEGKQVNSQLPTCEFSAQQKVDSREVGGFNG